MIRKLSECTFQARYTVLSLCSLGQIRYINLCLPFSAYVNLRDLICMLIANHLVGICPDLIDSYSAQARFSSMSIFIKLGLYT